MNPIRERVLDDKKGFVTKGEKKNLSLAEQVAILSGRLDKANKKLKDINKVWEERRSTDLINLMDDVKNMQRGMAELRRDNEKLRKVKESPKAKGN